MSYRVRQRSPIAVPIAVALVVAIVVIAVLDLDDALTNVLAGVLVLSAAVLVVLSALTVEVGDGAVTASFRFGWPARRIELADIQSVGTVQNAWWVGLGIRKVRRGWMYNVWGFDAVQLDLADGSVFRIGSADADGLLAAIESLPTR
jgi:hypothetical protein